MDNLIIIGKIISAYGIKGWVKIRPFTETAKNYITYKTQYLSNDQKNWNRIEIGNMRVQGQDVIADIRLNDRDQAIQKKGFYFAISRDDLPSLGKEEYYWDELIGLNVYDVNQNLLGEVIELLGTGANDVLVVSGDKERLIPYIPQVILEVDLNNKKIKVDWDRDF